MVKFRPFLFTIEPAARHNFDPYPVPPLKFMKLKFTIGIAAVAAAAVFAGLVHVVLVAAGVSEPGAVTVYGLTPRRLWATAAVILALAGVAIGWRAIARRSGRLGAVLALLAGLIAAVNGCLNLALATGGPGSGNGVIGGAAAFVLGLIALALGALALGRYRRTAFEPGRTT